MASAVLEHELSGLEWVPVSSSNLDAAAYVPDFARLWVRFKGGSVYVYLKVPPGVFDAFLSADSKGKYLDREVKKGGRYGYEQVR